MNEKLTPNILVVDDVNANLFVMKKLLGKHNAQIHTALSGMEAVEFVKNNHYAVALLDIQMPIMDGYETAKIFRTLPNGKNLPIIFVTAHYKSDESIIKGYESGAIDYLVKPVDANILNKKVQSYLLINQEMLEKKALIEELEKTKSQLVKINEQLRDYTHLISHDMKEPLRGISNYIEMLIEMCKADFGEAALKMISAMQMMSKHALHLLDSIIEYSQIDLMEKKLEKISLNELIDEIISFMAPHLDQKKATVKKSKLLPSLCIDPHLASTIFRNLIANAIKYSDKDGNIIEINYDPETSIFSLSDKGIGIPSDKFETIFQPLTRLHGKNEYGGGTGLGLAMVKKIVEMHGGAIWLESKAGAGTTFFFTLPACMKT